MKSDKDTKELDILLKSCLHTEQKPDDILHQKIMREWKEQSTMRKKNSYKVAVATIAGIMALSAISANAAMRFFTPSEVASEMGNDEISELFESNDAISINETQVGKNYSFTLLGITEGADLLTLDTNRDEIESNHFYAVVAISNIDGSDLSMQDFYNSETGYFISPLIQGLEPWRYNIASMNGGYSEAEIDGVVYRMIDCDKISYFADRELYLCISDTTFYETAAYNYDEATGKIMPNADYEGTNLLFHLPIDAGRADSDKAAEYMEELEKEWNGDASETGLDEETEDFSEIIPNSAARTDYMIYLDAFQETPEDIHSVLTNLGMEVIGQQTTAAADGVFYFEQAMEDGANINLSFYSETFKDGFDNSFQYYESETACIVIEVAKLNEDGTATCTFYTKDYPN